MVKKEGDCHTVGMLHQKSEQKIDLRQGNIKRVTIVMSGSQPWITEVISCQCDYYIARDGETLSKTASQVSRSEMKAGLGLLQQYKNAKGSRGVQTKVLIWRGSGIGEFSRASRSLDLTTAAFKAGYVREDFQKGAGLAKQVLEGMREMNFVEGSCFLR